MREEYDFLNAERGKFFRPDAKFNLPIDLEEEVLEFFSQRVEAKGVDLSVSLNIFLEKILILKKYLSKQ
jgi:hypothetical protein